MPRAPPLERLVRFRVRERVGVRVVVAHPRDGSRVGGGGVDGDVVQAEGGAQEARAELRLGTYRVRVRARVRVRVKARVRVRV